MNDLEICKRIAEIDGQAYCINQGMSSFFVDTALDVDEVEEYNPLTDDALCFQLMIKYKLSLIAPEGEQQYWDCVISDTLTVSKSPNKAICLAIIEAHNE